MAVSTTNTFSGPLLGNGATTAFPFTFKALTAAEVAVEREVSGVRSSVSSVDYTVTLASSGDGGTVTFGTAPASGVSIYIISNPLFTQEVEFANQERWGAEAVNEVNDRAVVRDLVLKQGVDRSIKYSVGYAVQDITPEPGKFIAFDAEGQPTTSEGTGSDSALRTDLAVVDGSTLVGFQASGLGSVARNARSKLRELALSITDKGAVSEGVAATNGAAFVAAIAELKSNYTLNPPDGVGTLHVPKGLFDVPSDTITVASAAGLVVRGDGMLATGIQHNSSSGRLWTFGPAYGYIHMSDMSFGNLNATPGTSIAIRLDPMGGGQKVFLERLTSSGHGTFVSIYDIAAPYENGDSIYMQNCTINDATGLAVNESTQSVINVMMHCSSINSERLYYSNGASEFTLQNHNGLLVKDTIHFGPLAGGQAGRVMIDKSKFEYHEPGGLRRMIYAEQTVNGEANSVSYRDSNLSGGSAVPADPDLHEIIKIDGGRVRIDAEGGVLRGILNYRTTTPEGALRTSFRYMEGAPKPENASLTGFSDSASHMLMEWRHNENVPVDQYRGGQRGNFSIDAEKAYFFHPFAAYLVNTGPGVHTTDFSGRKGANFTVSGLPARTYMFNVYVYILNDDGANTQVDLWAEDSSFTTGTILRTKTIAAGTRGLVKITEATDERTLTDGPVYMRITKPSLSQFTRGAIVIKYFPYMGAA